MLLRIPIIILLCRFRPLSFCLFCHKNFLNIRILLKLLVIRLFSILFSIFDKILFLWFFLLFFGVFPAFHSFFWLWKGGNLWCFENDEIIRWFRRIRSVTKTVYLCFLPFGTLVSYLVNFLVYLITAVCIRVLRLGVT